MYEWFQNVWLLSENLAYKELDSATQVVLYGPVDLKKKKKDRKRLLGQCSSNICMFPIQSNCTDTQDVI